ncbi:sensor histidine kinase [Fructobacillus parabroussonetiae]|nr:sensor histidine kinase [Fructobacillus parabroussonetiae]
MFKDFFKEIGHFIKDYGALYLFSFIVFFLQLWVTGLQTDGLAIFFNLLLPESYALLILTAFLAFYWQRKRRFARRLLKEEQLETIEEPLGHSSQEKLLRELVQKALDEKNRQADEQAEDKQQLKDYYALWAHQIKVPLSVLDLMNQTQTVDQKQTTEQLFLVNQYLEMLLSFIRLQDMKNDLSFEKLSARSLLLTVSKEYKVFFIQKDLSLTVDEGDFELITDRKWLLFVLQQIIYNAIKYTKEGGLRLTCTESRQIIIEDSGIGIDPADLPRVFQHGYTGYNGRVEDNASGLGLYLVKEILDRLGHTIQIESTVGSGTKVTIDCSQRFLS